MPLEHRQHEECHDVVAEVAREVADAQPSLRVPGIAKRPGTRGVSRFDTLAECRVAGKKISIRNTLGAGEREELRRFEAEVLRAIAAGEPIMLERFVGATLGEQDFSEHPPRAGMARLRRDGAATGA